MIGRLCPRLFGYLELEGAIFRPIQLRPQLLNFSLGEAQPARDVHDDLLLVVVSCRAVSVVISYAVEE